MPTPGGLPQRGDRVVWQPRGSVVSYQGTVVARGSGAYWSLVVKWNTGRTTTNVDAAYYWRTGELRLEHQTKEK